LDFSFGLDEFMARLNWTHLIDRFTRSGPDGQQTFSVDWAPIVDDDDLVQQILVSVRDITALEEARATATAATRDLSIMQQVFGIGFAPTQAFLEEERPRLREIVRLLDDETLVEDAKPTEALRSVFRLLHTMKGNARTIGLTELVSTVHHAEEPVAALSDGQETPREVIAEAVAEVTTCFDAHERLASQGSGGPARPAGGYVEDHRMEQIRDLVDEDEASARRRLLRIKELLDPPTNHTVTSLVEAAARGLPSLADELGKPQPAVTVSGPTVVLSDTLIGPIRDALVHLMRNALDHGIEEADERRTVGKPAAGTINVEVTVDGDRSTPGFQCRVFDDGRGLALERLRLLVADVDGLDPDDVSDDDAAEMIFRPGLSTNDEVSATSGRGVGMDAVRQFLGQHGGVVGVEFRGPEVDGYRPFAVVLDIPALDGAG
jgi:two-component system chemotaxis sensor kinase CheA